MTEVFFVGDMRSPFIKQDAELIAETHKIRIFDLGYHATSFWQIPTYLIASFSEMLHVHSSDAIWIWFADYPAIPFVIMSKLLGKPVVVNIGGYEVYACKELNYGNQLSPIRGLASRWILRAATKVVVMSSAYEQIVHDVVPETKNTTIMIYPSIDTSICELPLPEKKSRAITAYCIGQARELKGIPLAEEIGKRTGNVIIVKNKPHDELVKLLLESKVYLQLSRTEHFNITTLESMACGCIPVIHKADGLQDTVGMYGIIVDYKNIPMAIDAMNYAMAIGDVQPQREWARKFTKSRRKESIDRLLQEVCLQ
jgi:glycosyltransferase involved in cell wall biosynthesis